MCVCIIQLTITERMAMKDLAKADTKEATSAFYLKKTNLDMILMTCISQCLPLKLE